MNNKKTEIFNQYYNYKDNYKKYYKKNKTKLEKILSIDNVSIHSVKGRIKSDNSINEKIDSIKSELKNDIRNMNDIVAFRIVLYNNDDKDKFYSVLVKNYNVVEYSRKAQSTDDKEIVTFNCDYYILEEKRKNKLYKGFKFELQITTLIDSVIHDFGHDIFYKDLNSLKEKDEKAYIRISENYINAIQTARTLESQLKLISTEVEKIVVSGERIKKIISPEFDEKINNAKTIYDVYEIIDLIIESAPSWDQETIKLLDYETKLSKIIKLVEDMLLHGEEGYLYSRDMLLQRLLKLVSSYIYVNYMEFNNIINKINHFYLMEAIKANEYQKFLKTLIRNDRLNKTDIVSKEIFKWLLNNMGTSKFKLEINVLMKESLDMKLSTTTFIEPHKVKFKTDDLIPTAKYYANIKQIFILYIRTYLLSNFDKDYWVTIHDIIIKPVYINNKQKKYSMLILVSKFIYENYENVPIEYKLELYMDIYFLKNKTSSKYFKKLVEKLESDVKLNVFKNIFDWRFNDLSFRESEKQRDKWIEELIKKITITDINLLTDLYNHYNEYRKTGSLYSSAYQNLMISLGVFDNKIAVKVLTSMKDKYDTVCPYLFISTYSNSNEATKKDLQKLLLEERLKEKVLEAIYYYPEYVDEILNIIIKLKNTLKIKIALNKIIFRFKIYDNHYKNIFFKNLSSINRGGKYLDLSSFEESNAIFKKYLTDREIDLFFINLNIPIKHNHCYIIKPLFERDPNKCRLFLESRLKKHNEYRYEDFYYLEKTDNLLVELENNIDWLIYILKTDGENPYKLIGIIDHFIKEYDDNIEKVLMNRIKEKNNIIPILKILQLTTNIFACQKLIREIIKNNYNQKIEEAMFENLINTMLKIATRQLYQWSNLRLFKKNLKEEIN